MVDGKDKPGSPANQNAGPEVKGSPGQSGKMEPAPGQEGPPGQTADKVNPTTQHYLEGIYSSGSTLKDRPFLQKMMLEGTIVALEGLQGFGVNNPVYHDISPRQEAESMFRAVPEPERTKLVDLQVKVREATMNHVECPLRPDDPDRMKLAAYSLGHGNDQEDKNGECKRVGEIVKEYLGAVLARNGKPLNPNDPNERPQWLKENKLLAEIASLDTDFKGLHHPNEINSNNPNSEFWPLDQPVPPPEGYNHHLPKEFSTPLFKDKNDPTKDRVFNVQDLCQRQTVAIMNGEIDSNLDYEEKAVLELHMQTLEGLLPWYTTDQELGKHIEAMNNIQFLDAKGNVGTAAEIVSARDEDRAAILTKFAEDFELFGRQLDAVKQDPDWAKKWYDCRVRAMHDIPIRAQAWHSASKAEEGVLNDDQKKERCWDTRYQTDAELMAEKIRVERLRYPLALQDAVKTGLLFDLALVPKQQAELPASLRMRLRAIDSGVNNNQFRDTSGIADLPRIWAGKALRDDFQLPRMSPGIFGSTIVGADGKETKIATGDEMHKQVTTELDKWNRGYPWPLVYIPDTNNEENRSWQHAYMDFSAVNCAKSRAAREQAIQGRTAAAGSLDPESPDPLIRSQALRAQNKQLKAVEKKAGNAKNICACVADLPKRMDPFGRTTYKANQDPLFKLLAEQVVIDPPSIKP